MNKNITDSIIYIGADDTDLDLFESQYIVPNGVSYNSYVIMDEKIAIMDTIDARKTDEWLENLANALGDKKPDYLVVQHMEPDHSANILRLAEMYPDMKIVATAMAHNMMNQFFSADFSQKKIVAKEGDTLELGKHTLSFYMAPMVHWPEVMVTYDCYDKVLFAADGFGKFGALSADEDWACEARRYYFNIVGKYGAQVQMLLAKASKLDIQIICPLHGPILTENLGYYIGLYDTWSKYEPETKGVFVACASIHGNTRNAALKLVEKLEAKGVKVAFNDITRDDWAEGVEDAFRYDRMVLACATYDMGIFSPMENFINHLKAKTYKNRTVGIIENGSWAPQAGKLIKKELEELENITILDPVVTIKSTLNAASEAKMDELVEALVK